MIRTHSERTHRRTRLDPWRKSPLAEAFEDGLRARVVGREEAVRALTTLYDVGLAGLRGDSRPLGTILLLGAAGSGKTWLAEAAAEVLYGNSAALIKIDCADYQQPHEVARITGSMPAYLGAAQTLPLLTQECLDRCDRSGAPLSLILFNNVDSASPVLWQLIQNVLDRGTVTLGDNRRLDFRRAIVLFSSNLGADEIYLGRSGIGFSNHQDATGDSDLAGAGDGIRRAALEVARRHFSSDFLNSIDETVVFQPISGAFLREVLDRELKAVQQRILRESATKFTLQYSTEARELLLRNGSDQRYGARHLKRAIDRLLLTPLARLLTSGQVGFGDTIEVHAAADRDDLVFHRVGGTERELPVGPRVSFAQPAATLEIDQRLAVALATVVAVSAAAGLATGLTAAGHPLRRRA